MAKKPQKESGMPVLIALVFFVLSTVGLGVFCYVLYADQAAKDEAVEKAKNEVVTANKTQKIESLKAKLYRVALGLEEPEDRTSLIGESKPGDEYVAELKKINEAIDKRLASVVQANPNTPPMNARSVLGWAPDAENKLPAAGPSVTLLDSVARAAADREVARKDAEARAATYAAAATKLDEKSKAYDDASLKLQQTATDIQAQITKVLGDIQQASADKSKAFEQHMTDLRQRIEQHQAEVARANTTVKQLNEQVAGMKLDLQAREEQTKQGEQFYDQPLGKILRRRPDNTVEIDIGSNDKARAGLTFTVLPADYPIRGYQSRVQVVRQPDDRGQFRNVNRFVEKANIEIVEVLGPNSSRARIVSETDPIRDRILAGDLLYNATWRRGHVDHVALFGIFDTNGDGSDDIKSIVRDFDRMGIPVDAYFDLKEKKWVGQLTPRTRYAIKGYIPSPRSNDPFLAEKANLTDAISKAGEEAKLKGITVVPFVDIFPRMGYTVKLDVSDDKINQATGQYIQGVGAAPMEAVPQN